MIVINILFRLHWAIATATVFGHLLNSSSILCARKKFTPTILVSAMKPINFNYRIYRNTVVSGACCFSMCLFLKGWFQSSPCRFTFSFPQSFQARRRGDVRMYSVEMCLTALVWEATWMEISMSSLTAHWACHRIKYIRQWIGRINVQLFSRPLRHYRFGSGFWAFRRFKLECISSSNTMIMEMPFKSVTNGQYI